MESCDPVGTPMEIKDKLDLDQNGVPVDATKYRSMIGALMYLTSSRPDIVHATCLCARYQAKPTEKHLKEVKRIFRYLRGTVNMGLWYTKDSGFELTGFSDADYAGCKDTFKSNFDGAQFLGEKLVRWSSKKQDCTVLSNAEAEYVSLSACCAQILWMRTQLTDYGFHFYKILIYCDSKSAIAISCNPVQHSRTKHIAVCYHFIKEHVEKARAEGIYPGTLPLDRVEVLGSNNGVTTSLHDENDKFNKPSLEIETLKHTLSEHLKEKESLEQNITLLKNDFQKEESRNINRELALEKQTELFVEQAFWSQYSVQTNELNLSASTTIVEVLKELPKVSMRNTLSSLESAPTFAELFDINDLKAQAQAKDTVILKLKEKLRSLNALKEQLNKLKLKAVITEAISLNLIGPELLKVDVAPLAPKLCKNRTTHTHYIRHTQEEAATLREIIESKRLLSPLNTSLDYALTPKNKTKQIRLTVQITKSGKTTVTTPPSANIDSNIPVISSTGVTLVVQIVLWYLDFGCSKHMTGDRSQLVIFLQKFLGTVKFGNDHVAKIMGYGDYQIRNVTISRVYYVEGLGHNLFSVGQFCDSHLEVAFRQHTCFIHNLDGVDLLTGSRGNNLYTLSLQDTTASSPICLLSKASKTKSWLWHRRLSHLNFGAINHLARQGLVRGLPKLKFEKDHLCSACAMGKTRTMLIYAQALLFLWAKAVATACFTQNQSIIRRRHGKTPYELMHSKLPDLLFFYVFGALCYPTNDSENLGKLQPKADIRIFIGYAPTKKAFRIYNRRTKRIVETIHVDFDELTTMASEQSSLGHALYEMTPGTISSRHVQKSSLSTSYVPPSRNDWDLLFQLMFDELLNPPPSVVNQSPKVIAPLAEVIPPIHVDSTGSPSSTTVDQDAPSTSKSHTPTEIQSSVIPQDIVDGNLDMEVAHMGNDPLFGVPIPEVTSAQSSSMASPHSITYKEALTQSCWIEAMQEELNEFERLEVWELIPRPYQVMVITLKWIYKVKLDELGGILKKKARLVARGYR
nr:uncharacterized mitochondrial protein AtMg00810-like [Tanacetum cinerariifolium]